MNKCTCNYFDDIHIKSKACPVHGQTQHTISKPCDLQPPAESGSKKYCDHGQKEQDCPYCHIRLLESKLRLALDGLDLGLKNCVVIGSQVPCEWQKSENPECPHCRAISTTDVLAKTISQISKLKL